MMDSGWKKLVAGMVEKESGGFKSLMVHGIIQNIQSIPAYNAITEDEIKSEIERCLNAKTIK